MLATALSASIVGVDGVPVRVEVDVAFGLPGLTIVGLAGSAVLESRERVRAALRNSGFDVPARRITVNLAPASMLEAESAPPAKQLDADLGRDRVAREPKPRPAGCAGARRRGGRRPWIAALPRSARSGGRTHRPGAAGPARAARRERRRTDRGRDDPHTRRQGIAKHTSPRSGQLVAHRRPQRWAVPPLASSALRPMPQ
ncbi:MAG: magnesium chelatase domain-containing protein [Candidatus Limnocylindria bacterium]